MDKEEHEWLSKWFENITILQQEQAKTLKTINSTLTFIGIIVLLTVILTASSALGIL
jgi:hypothetical protein